MDTHTRPAKAAHELSLAATTAAAVVRAMEAARESCLRPLAPVLGVIPAPAPGFTPLLPRLKDLTHA